MELSDNASYRLICDGRSLSHAPHSFVHFCVIFQLKYSLHWATLPFARANCNKKSLYYCISVHYFGDTNPIFIDNNPRSQYKDHRHHKYVFLKKFSSNFVTDTALHGSYFLGLSSPLFYVVWLVSHKLCYKYPNLGCLKCTPLTSNLKEIVLIIARKYL